MLLVRWRSHGEVIVRLAGTIDTTLAARLTDRIVEAAQGRPVVLDLTHVRACREHELASLAMALGARASLEVRGLTRHQERVLRYLGVGGARRAEPGGIDSRP